MRVECLAQKDITKTLASGLKPRLHDLESIGLTLSPPTTLNSRWSAVMCAKTLKETHAVTFWLS